MTTIAELNSKMWYRLVKVIYFILYIPYFLILLIGASDFGQEYHPKVLPSTGAEAFKDPKFLKLGVLDQLVVLNEIDPDFEALDAIDKQSVISIMTEESKSKVAKGKVSQYIYEPYHSWNYGKLAIFIATTTFLYVILMESIRRAFYYIVLGKMFPR